MRSTGVWGALGGENLLICGPFAGLGLVRGMGRLVGIRREGSQCCDGARMVSTAGIQPSPSPAAVIAGRNRETPFTGLRDF